jgi:hypothetical protein
VRLGETRLSRGRHRVTLTFHGADVHPGSGGVPFAVGPLSLARGDAAGARIRPIPVARARSLCGRRWDWIESLGG